VIDEAQQVVTIGRNLVPIILQLDSDRVEQSEPIFLHRQQLKVRIYSDVRPMLSKKVGCVRVKCTKVCSIGSTTEHQVYPISHLSGCLVGERECKNRRIRKFLQKPSDTGG
jgi:hypothetical protein